MTVLAAGIAMGCDDVGSGLPVVLLHGFPHHRALWASQLNGLAAPVRTIAPDLRGFGESESSGPTSMDRYADDIAALCDQLGLDKIVLGGLSMGGYIAFAFWRRHRARVRALVLCDTRAGADSEAGRATRDELIALAERDGSAAVADRMLPGMLGRTTREKHPDLVESMREMMVRAPVAGVTAALAALRDRPDSTPTLSTIDVPTLIICGDEDVLTPVAESRAMHHAISGSHLELLAGAGHVSNVERPAAFNHVLSEFLTQLTSE
ncbi:MAG: alpha/beta hydrolase [Gemmatimonadaceae bacterium]|nr:alpha/beta hydrolase [Gemmatimonadaceae bacterium]